MGKKFVFYLKSGNRAITMTDKKEHRSLKELQEMISTTISGDQMVRFMTTTDCLILRPTEISGIHIQELVGSNNDSINSWTDMLDFSEEDVEDVEPIQIEENVSAVITDKKENNEKENVLVEIELPEDFDSVNLQIEDDISENFDISEETDENIAEEVIVDNPPNREEKKKKDKIEENLLAEPEKEKNSVKSQRRTVIKTEKKEVNDEPSTQIIQQIPVTQEISDPTMLFTYPGAINGIPAVGESNAHIFQREDGRPVPVNHLKNSNNPTINKVAENAKKSGIKIKTVPIKR